MYIVPISRKDTTAVLEKEVSNCDFGHSTVGQYGKGNRRQQ